MYLFEKTIYKIGTNWERGQNKRWKKTIFRRWIENNYHGGRNINVKGLGMIYDLKKKRKISVKRRYTYFCEEEEGGSLCVYIKAKEEGKRKKTVYLSCRSALAFK